MNLLIKQLKDPKSPIFWLSGGLILIWGGLLFVISGGLSDAENSLFLWIFNLPDLLRPLFLVITRLGSFWVMLLAFVLSYFVKQHSKYLTVAIGGAAAYALSGALKFLVNRPRPSEFLEAVSSKEIVNPFGPGFPSTHTALAAALAFLALPLLPKKWRPWAIVLAVLVALSRIYLGVHLPLDVIGGFGVGLAVAGFIRAFEDKDIRKYFLQKNRS